MGEVYRAKDVRLGREVAVKVLPADVASDAAHLARFEREARTVASLNHPNIVTLFSGRGRRRRAFSDDGAGRWGESRTARRARWVAAGPGLGAGDRAVGRIGGGARQGSGAPRPQAAERDADRRRVGQGARLRSGQAGPVRVGRGLRRHRDAHRPVHGGPGGGHAALHGSGTAPRRRGGQPHRSLLARRSALRTGDRAAALRRQDGWLDQ